jgi:hypothetical protein
MPIAPTSPLPPPTAPAAPHVIPQAQKVTPVEPAKRVTKGDRSGETGLRDEKRRRRGDDRRGGLYDVEA